MSIQKTIEQQRSGAAYQMVTAIPNEAKLREKYKSRAKNLPSLVRTNGLLQALSFLMSKSDNPKSDESKSCKLIAGHVQKWIQTSVKNGWLPKPTDEKLVSTSSGIIQWLTQVDVETYLTVTNEVLNFSPWLKRFAEGLIQSSEQSTENKEEDKDGQ